MSQLYLILSFLTIPSSLLTSWTPQSRRTDVPEIEDGWTSLLTSSRDGRFLSSDEKTGGWTSLGSGASPQSRKTDIPEIQDGWTSLITSSREGRLLSSDEKTGGWTSLLTDHQADSGGEKAAKIIATSQNKPEDDKEETGPEEKQFLGFGLPSYVPGQAGYYNPGQIYQVPSNSDITKDVFSLPHGLPDITGLNNHNTFPHSVLGIKLPTIFNSNLPIHAAANPLSGAINPNLSNNPPRFPPQRPNFPTPEFLPFPPIGPSNRPENTAGTTTRPPTTKKQPQKGNELQKPPHVPNTRPVRNKRKKKKHTTTTDASTIYDDVFDQQTEVYDDNFIHDEADSFAGLKPFEEIDLPQSEPTKNPSKFSSKPLQQLQDIQPFPGEITPSDVKGRLGSLDEILGNLHISSPGCQRRLICHLAKDPEKFTPLSHLVLDHLELQGLEGGEAALSRDDNSAHMARYLDLLQAVEAGRHRLCYKYSDVCQYKGEDMINSLGLRAWKLMYRVLTMKALANREGNIF